MLPRRDDFVPLSREAATTAPSVTVRKGERGNPTSLPYRHPYHRHDFSLCRCVGKLWPSSVPAFRSSWLLSRRRRDTNEFPNSQCRRRIGRVTLSLTCWSLLFLERSEGSRELPPLKVCLVYLLCSHLHLTARLRRQFHSSI